MKAPNTSVVIWELARFIATIIVAIPILVGLYTGAAFFGIVLPKPVWQDDLRRLTCHQANMELDVYGWKLERELRRREAFERQLENIPSEDRAGAWDTRREISRSNDLIKDYKKILDPSTMIDEGCNP